MVNCHARRETSPVNGGMVGLLDQLSNVQEEYRGMFRDLMKANGQEDLDEREDAIVALAITGFEMGPHEEPSEADLLWAIEIYDHLDTQNMQVVSK